jgi:hypothetical protein
MKSKLVLCLAMLHLLGSASVSGDVTVQTPDRNSQLRENGELKYRNFITSVATMPGSSKAALIQAHRLADQFELKSVQELNATDPRGCFLHISVGPMESPGFTIQIYGVRGAIYASDDDQLRRAVVELIQVMKHENGKVLLPVPLVMSSYPTIHVRE